MKIPPDVWVSRVVKPLVFVLALGPLAWLVWAVAANALGANPVQAMDRFLGDWAIRFLLIALAVSPVAALTKQPLAARLRRMLGLYAFFYAALHVGAYLVIDLGLNWADFWADILKRRYITVGMITIALLLPLAVTSTNGWMRRLGRRRWKHLHRLVYAAGALAVLHYFMMVKADWRQPAIYGAILAGLLLLRVAQRRRRA